MDFAGKTVGGISSRLSVRLASSRGWMMMMSGGLGKLGRSVSVWGFDDPAFEPALGSSR